MAKLENGLSEGQAGVDFFFKACRFGIRIFQRVFVKFRTISYLKKYHGRVFRSVDN